MINSGKRVPYVRHLFLTLVVAAVPAVAAAQAATWTIDPGHSAATFTVRHMPNGFFGPDVGRSADVIVPLGTEAIINGVESALDVRLSWWLHIMEGAVIEFRRDGCVHVTRRHSVRRRPS